MLFLCFLKKFTSKFTFLLSDTGVILVSMDENEHEHCQLKLLMDEIFGENNFVESIVWDKKSSAKGVPPRNMMVGVHEYILAYQISDKFRFLGENGLCWSCFYIIPTLLFAIIFLFFKYLYFLRYGLY